MLVHSTCFVDAVLFFLASHCKHTYSVHDNVSSIFSLHFICSSSTNTLTGEEARPHVNDCLPSLEPMLSMVLPATLLQNVGELTWIIQVNGQDKLILPHVLCVLLYSTYYPMYCVYYCTLHTTHVLCVLLYSTYYACIVCTIVLYILPHVLCVLLYSTYYPCIVCTIVLYILPMYCVYYCTLHTTHVLCVLMYSTYYPCIVCTIVLYILRMYCVYYCTLRTIHVFCVLLHSTHYPCIVCTIALYVLSMYCVYYCTLHTIHVLCVLHTVLFDSCFFFI